VKYNGTGRATVAGVAAGPDGLYFTDLYEDTGANGATAIGAKVWRVRYVGVPPLLDSADFNLLVPTVRFTLDSPIDAASVSAADLHITQLQTNNTTTNAVDVELSPDSRTLTFTLPTNLVDGDYRFRIPVGAITANGGAPNQANFDMTGLNVFFFAGDASRDRSIDIGDFSIIASRFNQSGTVLEGDANYDGIVDIGDFAILASKFNTSLTPPSLVGQSEAAPVRIPSMFALQTVDATNADDQERFVDDWFE
jgi:hypothetical protein